MIDKILSQELFVRQPPLLVDVGASGGIHERWKPIASYALCLAFDADDREMKVTESSASGFRKLITVNRIVTDRPEDEIDFYLTSSPFCSSALEPDLDALAAWPFQSLFRVEKKVRLKAVRLVDAMRDAGMDYVDWLKIDTQGTDLRIFKSLPLDVQQHVLAAEFEPGILDGYKGEDKMSSVMDFMKTDFFLSSMAVKGVPRLGVKRNAALSSMVRRAVGTAHRAAPGWAELSYLNLLRSGTFTSRDYQLLFVFALLEKQYGFAAEIARRGAELTGEKLFDEMEAHAMKRVSARAYAWPFIAARNKMSRWIDRAFT